MPIKTYNDERRLAASLKGRSVTAYRPRGASAWEKAPTTAPYVAMAALMTRAPGLYELRQLNRRGKTETALIEVVAPGSAPSANEQQGMPPVAAMVMAAMQGMQAALQRQPKQGQAQAQAQAQAPKENR
jgi:hypothetical protein